MQLTANARSRNFLLAGAVGVPLLALLWAYWTTLGEVRHSWSNPQYSYGYLVPVFAVVLLWLRRRQLDVSALRPSWWGLPILAAALAMRLTGTYFHFVWFDPISLVPCLAAVCLMLGGWAALRWAWPSIFFLGFMVPLPFSVANLMSAPLQRLATIASTFALQTFGLPAIAEGNVIHIDDARIGIVEACNGLRMLVVFFALSTGTALVIKAPLGDRLFLVASSVPIALVSNIIRITVTGVLHMTVNGEVAQVFFHDVAGLLMMPLALGMMWLELKILGKLLIEVPHPSRPGARSRKQPAAPTRRPRPTPTRPGAARQPAQGPAAPNADKPAAEKRPEEAPRPEHVSAHGASA